MDLTLEGKLPRLLTPSEQSAVDIAARRIPHSYLRRLIQERQEAIRVDITRSLLALRTKVVDKEISAAVAVNRSIEMLTEHAVDAASLGALVAGHLSWHPSDGVNDALNAIVARHIDYFDKWLSAGEAMDPDQRAAMYGGAADDALWVGWLAALPSTAVIHWRLSIAEHCPNCLKLEQQSPYSKPGYGSHALPTVPRRGDTRCLTNCKCFLESTGTVESSLFNSPGVEVVAIGGLAIDPSSPSGRAAAQLYQELAERYAWLIRMHELDPKAGYGSLAAEVRKEMRRVADLHGHSVRLTTTDAELLLPLTLAKAAGYKFVRPQDLSDDLVLLLAAILVLNRSERGVISSVGTNPPTVTLDHPRRVYRLDQVGRGILFLPE